MARPQRLSDEHLVDCLAGAFRRSGYEGASLSELASTTGLAKAALYHRFPGGKAEMAEAVEAAVGGDFAARVIAPLMASTAASERLRLMADGLMSFYAEGRHACLVEIFSIAATPEPVRQRLRAGVATWIDALATTLTQAGLEVSEAMARAEDTVIRVQGALVVSRALGDRRHFTDLVKRLPDQLLGQTGGLQPNHAP
jgi:AcrR family transcriptional regulator